MKKLFLTLLVGMTLLSSCQCNKCDSNTSEEAVINAIQTRVSVRQWTGEAVSDDQIQTLLKCAFAAPSAINQQPWAILVVKDSARIAEIGQIQPASRCDNHPSVVFLLCGDMSKAIEGEGRDYWIQDVSAMMENLLVAAHAMGIDGVWSGIYPIQEKVNNIRTLFELPTHIIPLGFAVIGHPAEQPAIKDKFKSENIHYEKW